MVTMTQQRSGRLSRDPLVYGLALVVLFSLLRAAVGALAQRLFGDVGLGSYTTLFSHGLDIAVIAPSAVLAGVLLLRHQPLGYILGSIILVLCTLIGPMVILQTIMQLRTGVVFRMEQVVVMIGGFLVMSLLAAGVTAGVFRQINDAEELEELH